jgi:hypothetical protein
VTALEPTADPHTFRVRARLPVQGRVVPATERVPVSPTNLAQPVAPPMGDVQRIIAAVSVQLQRAGLQDREVQQAATEVALGLLDGGWKLLPPGSPTAWGFRVPGLERVHEQGERAARRTVEAAPNLELVSEVRAGWQVEPTGGPTLDG